MARKKIVARARTQYTDYTVNEPVELMEFLAIKMPDASRTKLKSLLSKRIVFVDNVITTQYNYPLKPGMKVQISREKGKKEFQNKLLKIVYEDAYIIVVEKMQGLLSVSSERQKERTAYTTSAISKQFKGFLWDVGIPYRGKDLGPRVHDLRHTFVCHNLQRWAESGVPIQNMLPILSKYLGHTSISATQWYLRLTPEIYPHLREICERELGGMYANIPNFSREDACGE